MFRIANDSTNIEERRMDLLRELYELHPLAIFHELEQSKAAAFVISNKAAKSIRQGFANPLRRENESSALAKVSLAAQTPDASGLVYSVQSFRFENVGDADGVEAVERERLNAGEIEVHSHVYSRPDYLGKTDIGDLVAAIEGPAWISPHSEPTDHAIRIFGVLSLYTYHLARLQFYIHDLADDLSRNNNYGLKRLGMPITLAEAF
jgi:hypothetical protein